eukprot:642655-Pleurochrysis_carterae.AAC.1
MALRIRSNCTGFNTIQQGKECGSLALLLSISAATDDAMDQTLVHLRTDGPKRRAIFARDWIESEF